MELLQTPLAVYGKTLNNRIVFQPMEGCDGTPEGAPDTLTRRRYLRFAAGGAGLIWFEATAVAAEGRANPRQMYLTEQTLPAFRALVSEIRAAATESCGFAPILVAQLTHSGRFSKPEGLPAPMVAYRNPYWEKGREGQPYTVVTDEYCASLPARYAAAAVLAAEAGFDGVDVKCCHGYLLNEFLSAKTRPGPYGGDFAGRTRLYFECIDAVKAAAGDRLFVTTRLNGCDGFPYPYGFGVGETGEIDLAETKEILRMLSACGVELTDLTVGNPYLIPHVNRPWRFGPEPGETSFRRITDVTGELKRAVSQMKLVLSGLSFWGPQALNVAEEALSQGTAELAGFGRMTFAYPSFYRDWLASGALDAKTTCLACGKCSELMRAGTVAGCPVRDAAAYMPYYKKYVLKKED